MRTILVALFSAAAFSAAAQSVPANCFGEGQHLLSDEQLKSCGWFYDDAPMQSGRSSTFSSNDASSATSSDSGGGETGGGDGGGAGGDPGGGDVL